MLYSKGNRFLLEEKHLLTIVGSRKMTQYGKQVVEQIVPALVEAGVVLVSGFMYGVDQAVHRVCLECGGKTIGVLGWGIDWLVTSTDQSLYNLIRTQGLLVSEYSGTTKPQLWMFPQRDRIMAKLSQGTLVIEAAEGSGSLITAEFAKKFKKKLFAVPGPITSRVSAGTNGLIKSGQALLVQSAQEVLEVMNWFSPKPRVLLGLSGHSNRLCRLLENEALNIDELAVKLKQPVAAISTKLSILQLQGQVYENNGKFYLKRHAH